MEWSNIYGKRYLKASSLIESVIAITIIAICLLIALRLYVIVLDTSQSILNSKIKFQINRLVSDMKINQNFDSEVYNFKTYKIRKVVTNFENRKNLKKISYIVHVRSDSIVYNYLILKKDVEE